MKMCNFMSAQNEFSCFCTHQDCEIKEEGTKHILILYNVRMDMAGTVDFSAANAKSKAQLRVKGRCDMNHVCLHKPYFR